MNNEQKHKLIDALLACASIKDRDSRETVINDLSFETRTHIKRHATDYFDIANIVTACLNYGGLDELIECLQLYERGSLAMQKVHTLIHIAKESLNQDIAPIKSTPPKPSPPEVLTPTLSVSLTPHTEMVYIGDEVTWTLKLHNNGPLDLYDLIISRNRAILADEFDLLMGKHYSVTFKDSYQTEKESTEIIVLKASTNHNKRLNEKITATIRIKKPKPLSTDSNMFESSYRRQPIYFLVNTSGSMAGAPIEAINQELISFVKQLKKNPTAIETAYISIITFGNEAKVVVPLTEVEQFQVPKLQAGGVSSLGEALRVLDETLDKEYILDTPERKGDYHALIFLILDGNLTADTKLLIDKQKTIAKGKGKRKIIAIPFGQDIKQMPSDMIDDYFRWLDQDELP